MAQKRPKNTTELVSTKNWIEKDETRRVIQFISQSINFERSKKYNCWWCTLAIEENPMGCPLSCKNDVYYTEGVFCSANCIKSFYLENLQNDPKYQNTLSLLSFMYRDLYPEIELPINITPSPPWKCLMQYGGFLTNEQYKEKMGKVLYTLKGIIKQHPITFLSVEENIY